MNNTNQTYDLFDLAYFLSSLVAFLLFTIGVGWFASRVDPNSHNLWSNLAILLHMIAFPLFLLMSNPIIYGVIMIGSLVLLSSVVTALHRSTGYSKGLFELVSLAIFFFAVYPHQPVVQPTEAYMMMMPTRRHFFQHGIWFAQSMTDRKPCHYALLGWAADETLYFEAACKFRNRKTL